MKTFRNDLNILLEKLKAKENFAFVRFSDGEEFILQNKHLQILDNKVIAGDKIFGKGFTPEDHKNFIPEEHQFFREALQAAFEYQKHNYFKGICCKCCVGEQRNKWFLDQLHDHKHLTWANLLVNSNYSQFISTFIPEFAKHDIVLICNENADISGIPFNIEKDFRVGKNCIINNFNIIGEIKDYLCNKKNKVVLFSASSLSEVAIHQLYDTNDQCTYIDIGTTFNYYMKMSLDRGYLLAKWIHTNNHGMGGRTCIW